MVEINTTLINISILWQRCYKSWQSLNFSLSLRAPLCFAFIFLPFCFFLRSSKVIELFGLWTTCPNPNVACCDYITDSSFSFCNYVTKRIDGILFIVQYAFRLFFHLTDTKSPLLLSDGNIYLLLWRVKFLAWICTDI